MRIKQMFLKSNTTFWFLLTFLIIFLVLFIRPVFLKNTSMQFPHYIPAEETIGWDFQDRLEFSKALFIEKKSPYLPSNYYPPFEAIFFAPFIYLDYFTAYKIMTIINVLCFSFITIVIPILLSTDKRITPIHMSIIIASFFSYGFQFEIERGQFNVIAMFFALMSVYLFYFHKRKRFLAYVLLTVAIQLKVYPLIFALMFVEDWKDWKKVISQIGTIVIINLSTLFLLGPSIFNDFFNSITKNVALPAKSGANMSIQSFSGKLSIVYPRLNEQFVFITLFAIICLCILVVFFTKSQDKKVVNSDLLLACTIGAMLIPSVSWDFKLSILPPAAIYYINCHTDILDRESSIKVKARNTGLFLLFSGLFLWTFFSTYTNKPKILLLQSNFPPLFVLLLIVTIISVITSKKASGDVIAAN